MTGDRPPRFIDIHTLAALDIALHGAKFIIAEFAVGVLLCGVIGVRSLWAGLLTHPGQPTPFLTLMGVEMLGAALNYVPLLLYAVALARQGGAGSAAGMVSAARGHARRYGIQSLLILVPLAVAIMAVVQERRRRTAHTGLHADRRGT